MAVKERRERHFNRLYPCNTIHSINPTEFPKNLLSQGKEYHHTFDVSSLTKSLSSILKKPSRSRAFPPQKQSHSRAFPPLGLRVARLRASLLALLASQLGDPFVHVRKLLFKRPLKPLARRPHGVALFPICEAVFKDLAHVSQEIFFSSILPLIHFQLDGAEVHRPRDFVEIIWHAVFDRINGFPKRPNQTSPESCQWVSDLDSQSIRQLYKFTWP